MREADLDALLEEAFPQGTASGSRAKELAILLAQQVSVSEVSPAARRGHKGKMALGAGLSLVLLGGAGAAAAPVLMDWPPWEPDLAIEREFPVAGVGDAACTVVVRVSTDDATAGDDQDARLNDARKFLEQHDWSDLESATLASLPSNDVAGARAQGIADPLILTMHLSDQIGAAFAAAGYLGNGVSLEQSGSCARDSE